MLHYCLDLLDNSVVCNKCFKKTDTIFSSDLEPLIEVKKLSYCRFLIQDYFCIVGNFTISVFNLTYILHNTFFAQFIIMRNELGNSC